MKTNTIERPKVVSQAEWEAARKELLIKEKHLTRQRDEVDRQRRELPWVKVEKEYVFEGANRQETLADLFEGRSQLIVQHFMFGPAWNEGCVGCSFKADHVDAALQHIERHDVKFVAISHAPLAEIAAFQQRMGWRFKWVSSYGNDFNHDYHVSYTNNEIASGKVYYNYAMSDFVSEELSGNSVFYKDDAQRLPHLFHLRPWRRNVGWRLYVPRPHTEGPQRNGSSPQSD
jgi:predicted dithiol-disulfide oxidoreductase (DUF899 family)